MSYRLPIGMERGVGGVSGLGGRVKAMGVCPLLGDFYERKIRASSKEAYRQVSLVQCH